MTSALVRDHTRTLNAVLVLAALSTVGLGLLIRLVLVEFWDPWWARLSVAGAILLLAAANLAGVREVLLRGAMRAMAYVATGWVVLLLWGNDFPAGLSSGVVVVQTVCVVLFPSYRLALSYTVALVAGLVAAGTLSDAPASSYLGLASTAFIVGGILTLTTNHRARLAEALIGARDQLEDQVEERTRELRSEVAERRRAEVRAVTASTAKSRFLATMSHELRTPLTAILGYTELVEETVEEGPTTIDVVGPDLKAIRRSGRHLLALVDDVLDLSRIEAGSLELDTQHVAVEPLVARAVDEVRLRAERKGLQLMWEGTPHATQAWADPQRTLQVLMNLLSNAVKFTDAGSVEVWVHPRQEGVAIEVRDSGIGIDRDGLKRLFTPFVQLDDTSTRTEGGTGLGLALSRDLAHQMGGDITVRSVAGQGSSFTLLLPSSPPSQTSDLGRAREAWAKATSSQPGFTPVVTDTATGPRTGRAGA